MHLTRFSDNSLRCLILLGLERDRAVPIPEIATRMGMSYEHLVKIVQRCRPWDTSKQFVGVTAGRG